MFCFVLFLFLPEKHQCGDSQGVVPGPEAAASSGNLLETQILGSHPRTTESETLEVSPASSPAHAVHILTRSPGDSDAS